jgi:membrane-associated phospholipid phosphatase
MVLPALGRRWRAPVWAFAVAVPLTVGYTRVGLDVHWTSDVIGGWLLGIAIVAGSYAMLTELTARRRVTSTDRAGGAPRGRGVRRKLA